MFCIPANYSKFNPPLNPPGEPPAEVQIGLDNFEILKIDDREFTIEINAYFIVKWRDKRIEVGTRWLVLLTWWSLQNCLNYHKPQSINNFLSEYKSVFDFTSTTTRANLNKWILSESLIVFRFIRRQSTTTSPSWGTTLLTGFLWSWRWWRDSGYLTLRYSDWRVSGSRDDSEEVQIEFDI